MAKKQMDITNFLKIYEMFGEKAAQDTYKDVEDGKIRESTLEKYLYTDESKEAYEARKREEFASLE